MILDAHFAQRKSDVDAHFCCLQFIDCIESHKNRPIIDPSTGQKLLVSQQVQCCLKGQTLVVLYNLVESTVCECLNFIYDSVADDNLTYADLTDEMRIMWTASCRRAKRPEKDLSEAAKMSLNVTFSEIAVNTSGNIDIRKIFDIFKDHGCELDGSKRERFGQSFLTVKNKRNQLAHGNVSFSQCGSAFLYRELNQIRQDIESFLAIVVDTTKKFVEEKKYRR